MSKEKIKVYLYTRVSTTMQIDGYSLDAQKTKMKAFCDYNEYEIAGEYEDAGKSGKSIEGRIAFNQMMDDIKSGKDEVSYVLVFKLSRFGRNAADVLATLQVMQDFGVNLICVEDGIDSSKDAGKLMISVLSAVAEIERENIRVQTMEGRMQKARKVNGMVVLFKMFAKSHIKKKYPIEGFTVEWKRNDSNEIHFDIARCLYRDMCEKYCCPELCTVFCQSDITAFSGYEPKIRFERAGTLGEGADCCDFHFIHGSH